MSTPRSAEPETVAAIDCGTNSIRLLIARRDRPEGPMVDLDRRLEMVRLGYGVDRTGRLDPAAIQRTLDAARGYAELIAEHEVDRSRVRFVATSATRDAANREEFTAGVREILGVDPEVISGDEEAELSFRGAVTTVPDLSEGARLVVDIGGGSTELVIGVDGPQARLSLDIGSVRLTERHLRTDPPTAAEIAAATADVDALLDRAAAQLPLDRATSLVGVAGTVTTVTAVAKGLTEYRPDVTHGARLGIDEAVRTCDRLLAMTRTERSQLRIVHPGRVDVIGAGALIWARVMRRVAEASGIAETRTSEHDILDGLALSILDRGGVSH